jgi:predicted transcriptional regulator
MDDEVLELETRQDIYDLIKKFPGLHMREIQRKLNIPIALAEYHLNIMEEAEVVSAIKEGGYKRYYEVSERAKIGFGVRKQIGVLRQKIPLSIVLYLLKNKSAKPSNLSQALNINPSKLSFHLKKLRKINLIRRLKPVEGKGYVLVDEKMVHRLLLTYKPPMEMLEEFADLWENLSLID